LNLFDTTEQVNFRRQFNLPHERQMIFFSGRMEPRKGIHLCQDIATSILERYEVALVFAGQDLINFMSDVLLPHLKTKKLRGSVHYLGKLDLTTIRSALHQADIFLLPVCGKTVLILAWKPWRLVALSSVRITGACQR